MRPVDQPLDELQAFRRIERSPEEIYRFWRQYQRFDEIFFNVISVVELDADTSRWTVRVPSGGEMEFLSRITEDVPNERIAWASTRGLARHHGLVTFRRDGTGTMVGLALRPTSLLSRLGVMVDRLRGKADDGVFDNSVQAEIDLALKQLETVLEENAQSTPSPRPESEPNHAI